MIKVSDIVSELLYSTDLELEAMRKGLLNLSAYAEQIHPEVEKRAWKEVKKTTIVVALSRLQAKVAQVAPLRPQVNLNELSVKSPLADITFEKTQHSIKQSRSLSAILSKFDPQFLTITQGINEITVVVSQDQVDVVLQHFQTKPKATFADLVGVTVSFSEKYLAEPNVIYAVLSALASKRINIVEIVSTYTELSVIIGKTQLELCIQTLNQFFTQGNEKRVI
jgi:aspartokinase